MNKLLVGSALGALAMYLLDPDSGRRRRARARDQALHAAKVVNHAGKVTLRDTAHRAQGLVAGTRRLFQPQDVSDESLIGRVRAALGRVVSHPHAIQVFASSGHVTLEGPILAQESRALLKCVRSVPGVRAVNDELSVYESPDGIPALQGGTPRYGTRFELMQDNWSPAARFAAGVTGAGLMTLAAGQRGVLRMLFGAAGGGLLARAATNLDFASLFGAGRGIAVQKVIHVDASPARVFAFWIDFQNFPRFMSKVKEVQPVTERRSRWVVSGPAGVPVDWTAEITRVIADSLVEWHSTPESSVRHEGSVRFADNGRGGTRVEVHLRYRPPAGPFGHAVARMFGADPKAEMDADLLRMKTAIETGHAPHDAAKRLLKES